MCGLSKKSFGASRKSVDLMLNGGISIPTSLPPSEFVVYTWGMWTVVGEIWSIYKVCRLFKEYYGPSVQSLDFARHLLDHLENSWSILRFCGHGWNSYSADRESVGVSMEYMEFHRTSTTMH